jgi:hypothetical protein
MMVAPADEMVHANPEVSRRAFDLLPGEKDWYDIDDGHFGLLYHPSDLFDDASTVRAAYLTRHFFPSHLGMAPKRQKVQRPVWNRKP